MVCCLKYRNYFSVRNLPRTLRQSSFFNVSRSNFLCDYPHDNSFLRSYPKATLCVRSFLSVPCVNSTGCLLMQSLGLIQQAMRSGASLLLASLNFGSGFLPLAFGTVASITQLFSLSASALPGDQSNNCHCDASKKQEIQEKKKNILFLFKDVPETLFSHHEIKEKVPKVNQKVSVCIHFSSLLSLLKLARLSISTPLVFFLELPG